MKNHWLDEAKKRLQVEANPRKDVLLERLQAQGMIDERGEVTGKLHQWDAFLAITAVKHTADGKQIEVFRCLEPVFGMPGGATIDISRNSMVTYLKEGKKVITCFRDDKLGMWREGCMVHLSPGGWIVSESADEVEDNVGGLSEFQRTDSRL